MKPLEMGYKVGGFVIRFFFLVKNMFDVQYTNVPKICSSCVSLDKVGQSQKPKHKKSSPVSLPIRKHVPCNHVIPLVWRTLKGSEG